ncbi:MAG: nuclear transport factor 2 family protein, partial [Gemmatimonadales bacterium]
MATATKSIETELLELERRFWQALQDQDVDTAAALTDEPCILTGAQGVSAINRRTFAAMMKAPTWKIDRFEIKEGAQVRLLGENVAIVAYEVHEELTVDGKPVAFDAADASTWVRRDGRWLCAL